MPFTTDTLDVLTEREARDAIGGMAAPSVKDDELSRVNTAVARRLDRLVGPVVRRTVTAELQRGGTRTVWLRQAPAYAISSITEYDGATSQTLSAETLGAASPANGYLAERHASDPTYLSGRIVRRSSGNEDVFWPHVSITYTAGRYADTASVDERFKKAASLMLANLWRASSPSLVNVGEFDVPMVSFPTFVVPKAVLDLLADEVIEIPGIA